MPTNVGLYSPRNVPCAPASKPTAVASVPTIQATLTDPDGRARRLSARVEVYLTYNNARVWVGLSPYVLNPSTVRMALPSNRIGQGTYKFRVRADDTIIAGKWSSFCYFRVDQSGPNYIEFESSDYPLYEAYGRYDGKFRGGDRAFGKPGQPGKIRLDGGSDAVRYAYKFSTQSTWSEVTAPAPGVPATATVVPPTYGVQTLMARAWDEAGNPPANFTEYQFRVGGAPGPADRWTFDETDGSTASNTGTSTVPIKLEGATWTKPARLGGALELDGVDDRAATTGIALSTAHTYSLSLWVRPDAMTTNAAVLRQAVNGRHGLLLQYSAERKRWGVEVQDSRSDATYQIWSEEPVAVGQWTQLTVVYVGSKKILRFYVNGVLAQFDEIVPVQVWTPLAPLELGHWDYPGREGGPFKGAIDNLQIWDRPLPVDEIHPLYEVQDAAQEPRPALAARWKFDEQSGTVAADSSGHGNDVTFQPGVQWRDDPARGKVVRLDGTATAWGQSGGPTANTGGSYTLATWVRPTSGTGLGNLIGQVYRSDDPFSGAAFTLALTARSATAAKWEIQSYPVPDARSGTSASAAFDSAGWMHVAVVKDVRGSVGLYLNGTEAASIGGDRLPSTEPVTIGRELPSSIRKTTFTGDVDDLRIYDGALSSAQVKKVMAGTF